MKNINIKKILKRSWELTWNNKWLWVMGLVLAIFSGGSGFNGANSRGSSGKTPTASPAPNMPDLQNIKDQTSMVLGDATNVVVSWFKSIPPSYWILIGFGIFFLTIFTMVTAWIIKSWAKGALIYGLDEADMGKPVTLKNTSPKGIAKIKDLIVFGLISGAITTGLVLIIGLMVLIGFILKVAIPNLGMIWLVLFGIVAGLAFIIAIVLFSMLTVYSERLIVIKNYSPWEAWKKGLSLTKGNFIPTFVMSLVDGIIGCSAGCLGLIALLLAFSLPTFLLIYPMFKGGFHVPSGPNIVGIIILIILFFSIYNLFRAVMVVFSYGNWNLLFKEILEKEENGK